MELSAKDLIIGESGCRFRDISYTMEILPGAEILVKRWTDLAARLGTNPVEVIRLGEQFKNRSITLAEIITEILTEWRMAHPEDATLGNLFKHLEGMRLNAMAKKLEAYFNNPNRELVDLNSIRQSSIATVSNKQEKSRQGDSEKDDLISERTEEMEEEEDKKSKALITEYTYKMAFAMLIGFLLLAVGMQIKDIITNRNNDSVVVPGITQSPLVGTRTPVYTKKLPKDLVIQVSSHHDYISSYNNIVTEHGDTFIELEIRLNVSSNWNQDALLPNAHLIKILKLEGAFHFNAFLSILSQASNITELYINNNNNTFCKSVNATITSYDKVSVKSIKLPRLEKITFSNLTSCAQIYDRIAKTVEMVHLRELVIFNGTVNDENVLDIQKLLHQVRGTLQNIDICGTKHTQKYFYSSLHPFLKLIKMKLNLIFSEVTKQTGYNAVMVGKEFPTTFANLEYFKSGESVSYVEFIRLLEMPSLKSLHVKVSVDADKYNKDISNVYTGSNLEYVRLVLLFENEVCPTESQLRRLGIYKLKRMVKNICIKSNCRLRFRRKQVVNDLRDVSLTTLCSMQKELVSNKG